MLKVIVLFALLFGSGWTSSQQGVVNVHDTVHLSKSSLSNELLPQSKKYEPQSTVLSRCRSTTLNITVSKSIVNVGEWRAEKDVNVSYEMVISYISPNISPTKQLIKQFKDVALPVQHRCTIFMLNVSRTDSGTSDCVYGLWKPNLEIVQLQILETGSERKSYVLTWIVEMEDCVDYYEVLKLNDKSLRTNIPFITLQDLKPYERHRIQISVKYQNGDLIQRYVEIFVHHVPDSLKSSLDSSRCSFDFTIQQRKRGTLSNSAKFNVSRIAQPITNATVCARFSSPSFSAKSLSTIRPVFVGSSVPKKPSAIPPSCPVRSISSNGDVTIRPQTIGPVRDLRAITDIDRSILLTWRPPKDSFQCVKEYLITWSSESQIIDASNTTYNVTNLESCATYEFTVNAIDHANDKGEPASVTATVRELQQLSEVTELELNEVEPRSLSVKWKPPINGSFCVEAYRVVAWYNTPETGIDVEVFSNTTNDQHVTFGEVIACMVYTVQVIPISISKKDGLNEIGSVKTKERTILSYHVEPIRGIAINSRSLELSTMLLSENNNNCLLISVQYNCTLMEENEPVPESQIVKEFVIPNSNTSFEGIVEPLNPFSVYMCNARIQNIAGWSDPTPSFEFKTAEDVPDSPSVLELVGQNRSIEIIWKAPTVKNGVVVRYRIHVRMIAPEYPLPKLCTPLEEFNETVDLRDEVNPDEARSWDGVEFQHVVAKLNPYTLYTVQVAAATGAGLGPYTEPKEVITLPDVSNTTESFRVDKIEGPELDQPYKSSVWFSWSLPCGLHGRLTRFVGRMEGIRDQDPSIPHAIAWDVNIEESEVINDAYSYVENRLKPEYNYTVSLSVEVANVSELSPNVKLQFESPAGIPTIDHTEEWFNVDVFEAPNPTNTARIVLGNMTLTSDFGSIRYMALLISERLCQQDPEPRTDFIDNSEDNEWPEVLDWYRANNMRCVEQYQTTPKFWNPINRLIREERRSGGIEYVVGKDSCEGQEYCNGPLKPGTEYALIVRIFSRSGYTDSEMQVFRTDSLIKVGLIVSAVIGCLLLAFIGGLVIVWRKQRLLLPAQQTGRAPTEEPSDIPLKNFPAQFDELFQSNREKVSKEFQAINYFSDFALQETVTFQSARENERKNRYINILPFDSNRVLLDCNDDDENIEHGANDYINASFIEGYKYQREYIATQGPKQETCYDFWRMVLQYEIESIVMLTQPIDHDKNKCCQYFPRFDEYIDFGDIRVKCTQELNLSLYYKRLFLISKENVTKAVFHYHFLEWPDHNCPASTADLIKFSKIVRAERKSNAIPLVIHCSAGVGRTGTFIALDIILQRMLQEKKINVYDTVKRLRRQRVKMVQTLDQYAFLYQCCLEYVSKNNRKKPKTSSVEIIRREDKDKQYPDVILDVEQLQVAVGNGGKPMFNIKFPKSVNAGLGNVNSFAPSEIESDK
ncbi:phosphatidylinositol phosphatase PTPRQ [Anopheles funestus]|uniref:phosphatidylinositol phosphatase PTPRQ n=1 Tax=Anopheles funestus TaxID=62324 RepID=UPI0020C6A0AD|nr:phosphatidylinositol phosphatase PTPRQ [Anopheles funestus]XP_049289869.1 phosphatidylinositol phosphatase PTPRQ [Anopheles funestus]XP_049289871.1 phosphatidylinositol phosphatase PTPRQ [Anopheles funestus]